MIAYFYSVKTDGYGNFWLCRTADDYTFINPKDVYKIGILKAEGYNYAVEEINGTEIKQDMYICYTRKDEKYLISKHWANKILNMWEKDV